MPLQVPQAWPIWSPVPASTKLHNIIHWLGDTDCGTQLPVLASRTCPLGQAGIWQELPFQTVGDWQTHALFTSTWPPVQLVGVLGTQVCVPAFQVVPLAQAQVFVSVEGEPNVPAGHCMKAR